MTNTLLILISFNFFVLTLYCNRLRRRIELLEQYKKGIFE